MYVRMNTVMSKYPSGVYMYVCMYMNKLSSTPTWQPLLGYFEEYPQTELPPTC